MVTGSCYRIVHPGGQFLSIAACSRATSRVRALNDKPMPFDAKAIRLCAAHTRPYRSYRTGAASLRPRFPRPTAPHRADLGTDGNSCSTTPPASRNTRPSAGAAGWPSVCEPPIAPLYTLEDAEEALKHRNGHKYEEWVSPGPGVRFRLWNAGHILGSASIEVEVADGEGKTVTLLSPATSARTRRPFTASRTRQRASTTSCANPLWRPPTATTTRSKRGAKR